MLVKAELSPFLPTRSRYPFWGLVLQKVDS
jgi:hypothetical protein